VSIGNIFQRLLVALSSLTLLGCGGGSVGISEMEIAAMPESSLFRSSTTIENSNLAIAISPSGNSTSPSTSVTSTSFALTSDVGIEGGTLPTEYTCDGTGSSPALSWFNAPAGTRWFVLLMTTLPGDGTTKWNWVLHSIPATITSLAKNSSEVGTLGVGSDGPTVAYQPPCSQGPGTKVYTFTLYALSASPTLPDVATQVTGATLMQAISSITLGSTSLSLNYSRSTGAVISNSAANKLFLKP